MYTAQEAQRPTGILLRFAPRQTHLPGAMVFYMVDKSPDSPPARQPILTSQTSRNSTSLLLVIFTLCAARVAKKNAKRRVDCHRPLKPGLSTLSPIETSSLTELRKSLDTEQYQRMPWDHTLHVKYHWGTFCIFNGVLVGHGVPATPRRFPGNLALGSHESCPLLPTKTGDSEGGAVRQEIKGPTIFHCPACLKRPYARSG
ncbi:hypothetical protein X797_004807 [Metarhizium robertsii]|uniref:Uncharacterized protein n=1 Tax=Metarhizium robertsii TaxID=568076 RepID=A0A0A1UVV0_9HYPO|nr:hypothetical protein X797_004807 [Metarhizium robertsii]